LACIDATLDQERVYATGGSAGGFISNQLGLQSDRFAAIAPISGTFWRGQTESADVTPLSVLLILGQRDSFYDGVNESGIFSVSARDSLALWADYNGCNPVLDADTSHVGITIYRHENCDNSTEVVLLAVHEGGHWPPTVPLNGSPTDLSGDLFELVWGFFQGGSETLISSKLSE